MRLEQEQADMRKRWAAPAYRLEYGSVNASLPTAEFTLGTTTLCAEQILEKLEEIYVEFRNGSND